MVRCREIKCQKQVHPAYQEFERFLKNKMPGRLGIYPIIEKDWYIYLYKEHRISLILLGSAYYDFAREYLWESCGGGITRDVVRYRSRREAERHIIKLFKKMEKQARKPVLTPIVPTAPKVATMQNEYSADVIEELR